LGGVTHWWGKHPPPNLALQPGPIPENLDHSLEGGGTSVHATGPQENPGWYTQSNGPRAKARQPPMARNGSETEWQTKKHGEAKKQLFNRYSTQNTHMGRGTVREPRTAKCQMGTGGVDHPAKKRKAEHNWKDKAGLFLAGEGWKKAYCVHRNKLHNKGLSERHKLLQT